MKGMEQGRIVKVQGHRLLSQGPRCRIGDLVLARTADGRTVRCLTEGFEGLHVHLLALEETRGLGYGDLVLSTGRPVSIQLTPVLRGRLLDGFGTCSSQETAGFGVAVYPTMTPKVQRQIPLPLDRKFHSGVRAIDALLTLGAGQRVLFHSYSSCPSLLRKTTSMMARYGKAQTVVFGLIGYKQREVEQLKSLLDQQTGRRCVIFSAPTGSPAGERFHCGYAATTCAEFFRDQGEDVLLVLDSMQQWQKAYCELSALETEQARELLQGATLAQLVERAGRRAAGSITAVYCLCGSKDSLTRELSELVESRIVFTLEMESLGVYPPIDILKSTSYNWSSLISPEQQQLVSSFHYVLRYFERNKQLIRVGALFEGLCDRSDRALERVQRCWHFLRQGLNEPSNEIDSLRRLAECVAID